LTVPQRHHAAAPQYRPKQTSKSVIAVVTLYDSVTGRRRDVPLGEYDSPASRTKYAKEIVAWEERGRRLDDSKRVLLPPSTNLSVNEALEMYVKDLERRCRRPDGTPTGTIADVKITVGYLIDLFGELPLAEFGADHLERLRDELIADGRVRPQVNKRVSQARQIFTWCVGRRLVPVGVDVYRTIIEMKARVKALAPGEYGVRPGKVVRPADPVAVDKALPFLPPAAQAVVKLLRLTGARPSEILDIRLCELDQTGEVWVLRPTWHKTLKKGKDREIFLGPEARSTLAPWLLSSGPEEFVFTPARSEELRLRQIRDSRTTPRWPSHVEVQERKRIPVDKRKISAPGERYTPRALACAIRRACSRAGVKAFSPYSLRHLRAVELRAKFGLETVRATLGHSAASMAAHYSAAADAALAGAAALAVG
jgi:integrase